MTSPDGKAARARVLIACSGLEHAHRGYESLARECFDRLRDDPRLDLHLVKATGAEGERERAVPAIKRDAPPLKAIARKWSRGPLVLEEYLFAFSIQREIRRLRPDVIYLSEFFTGIALNQLRAINRQDYALVLSNGSMADTGFEWFDRVQQHTAPALKWVLRRGADPPRHVLLPLAFNMPRELEVLSPDEKAALRDRLGLPRDRTVVISVAALNRWHKRLDYLISEVARLPEPRPYVLLVGHPEAETESIRALGRELLGEEGHSIRSVPRKEVDDLLRASDAFILTSLAESLPRALIEGMSFGLPCLVHDYPIAHYALEEHGVLGDFEQPGGLAGLLRDGVDTSPEGARARHRYVYERFSWETLAPQYVDMLHGAVGRADFNGRRQPTAVPRGGFARALSASA